MGEASTDDDLLLKNFFAEVSEVERDNEVLRFFSLSLSLQLYMVICRVNEFCIFLVSGIFG